MKASWLGIAAAALMFAGQAGAADVEAGRLLFNKLVCKGCHAIDSEGFGPPFVNVGKKYANVADARKALFVSIKNGSVGKWGEDAMPAQEKNVTDEQIETLLDFILSLK